MATRSTIAYGPFTRRGGPARTAAIAMTPPAEDDGDVTYHTNRLAAGDLNGDGITDPVAAVVQEGLDDTTRHRCVRYALGTPSGLAQPRYAEASAGQVLKGGEAVAVGDLDEDGYADIVFGRSDTSDLEESEAYELGGVVGVLRGSAAGTVAKGAGLGHSLTG